MSRFALVMVDDSGGNAFDYELPEAVAEQLQVGSRVRVPVRTRTALGTILELRDTTEARGVKPIAEVVSAEPILSPLLIRLGAWMAEYYCCPIEAAMRSRPCSPRDSRPMWSGMAEKSIHVQSLVLWIHGQPGAVNRPSNAWMSSSVAASTV